MQVMHASSGWVRNAILAMCRYLSDAYTLVSAWGGEGIQGLTHRRYTALTCSCYMCLYVCLLQGDGLPQGCSHHCHISA
jgi:hypothetical protein